MKEIWKKIPEHPTYEVSNKGKVRSLYYRKKLREIPRLISIRNDTNGYPQSSIEGKRMPVHSLVLLAFVSPRPKGYYGCHYDGNPTNNHIENLRWDTPKANYADSVRHETNPIGERNGKCKLKECEVIEIRRLHKLGVKNNMLSKMFKQCCKNISQIVLNKRWKHL